MGGDRNAAILSFSRGDFHLALEQSKKAIADFESCPSNFIDERIIIAPISKATCYKYASTSAQILGSNELANEYALKLIEIDPSSTNKMLLATTLANMAIQRHAENNYTDSFRLYQSAITNYESCVTNLPDFLALTKRQLLSLYSFAAQNAFQIGKTNEAVEWANKATAVFQN
jgi:tetratricopeptide (TPR) repeat protein